MMHEEMARALVREFHFWHEDDDRIRKAENALARAHAEGKAEGLREAVGVCEAATKEWCNFKFYSMGWSSGSSTLAERIRSLIPAAPLPAGEERACGRGGEGMKTKIQRAAAPQKAPQPDPHFRIRSMYKDGLVYICTQDFVAWMATLFLLPPTPAELEASKASEPWPPAPPPASAPAAGQKGEG